MIYARRCYRSASKAMLSTFHTMTPLATDRRSLHVCNTVKPARCPILSCPTLNASFTIHLISTPYRLKHNRSPPLALPMSEDMLCVCTRVPLSPNISFWNAHSHPLINVGHPPVACLWTRYYHPPDRIPACTVLETSRRLTAFPHDIAAFGHITQRLTGFSSFCFTLSIVFLLL